MTSWEPSAHLDPAEVPQSSSATAGASSWARIEDILERAGERLNPILVKEARQALKSKQFLITFTLLLACGWAWSLLGIALLSPGIYYAPGGSFMFIGYYLVLAAPVLIIVPFSAFRSLASEREDGTFELLSITSLNSRQIVTGKLGSSVLQMLVYYSALAPCIFFSYLLQGVDIISITLLLAATMMLSLLLSSAGLVVATVTRARHWQVVLSVLLLMGLMFATLIWSVAVINIVIYADTGPFNEPLFWVAMFSVFTFFVSFVVLLVLTSAAQISFASDNRSTKLRVVMFAQQVLWVGWMTYAWVVNEAEEILFTMIGVATVYWFLMGALMTGETAQLSPRVKRSLPQSFLGRMAFTWFNPGSGTGYTFAVTNLFSVLTICFLLGMIGQMTGFGGTRSFNWLIFGAIATCYVAAYLGVGRLIALAAGRFGRVGQLLTFLTHIFLAMVGAAIPAFFQAWLQGYGNLDYTSLQATNWVWTLAEAAEGHLWTAPAAPIVVVVFALAIWFLNLVFAVVEVEQIRQATPERVVEDELQLHPERAEPVKVRLNPWDGEEAGN